MTRYAIIFLLNFVFGSQSLIASDHNFKNVSELLKTSPGAQRGLVQVLNFAKEQGADSADSSYMTLRGAFEIEGLSALKTCLDYQAKEILQAKKLLESLPLSQDLVRIQPLSRWAINFKIYDNSMGNLSETLFEAQLKSGLERLEKQTRDQYISAFEPENLSQGPSPGAGLRINRNIQMGGIDGTCDFQIAVHASQLEGAPSCDIIRAGTITRAIQNIDR